MARESQITALLLAALIALFAPAVGCATPETETVPLETLAAYDEEPNYDRSSSGTGAPSDKAVSDECRELRESIDNWETAYGASIGVGALGFATGAVGLLTGNEEAQKVGGALGVLGTLAQGTTATGAEIQTKKAVERECWRTE